MMPSSGFRRNGHLNFINQIKKIKIEWPQQPLADKVLKFNMIYYFFVLKFIFSHFNMRHPVAARALADHSFLVFYISILFFRNKRSIAPNEGFTQQLIELNDHVHALAPRS